MKTFASVWDAIEDSQSEAASKASTSAALPQAPTPCVTW